ncbi:hypothetical protein KSS87_002237, partial [Heliosperma pusillum]
RNPFGFGRQRTNKIELQPAFIFRFRERKLYRFRERKLYILQFSYQIRAKILRQSQFFILRFKQILRWRWRRRGALCVELNIGVS